MPLRTTDLWSSRIVPLLSGKAQVTIPYQREFRRTVVFVAWSALPSERTGSKAVIFPGCVRPSRDRFCRAGGLSATAKKATLRMQVSSADGRPVEAALGLAVVDQAVLERARTDDEFGHRSWFACAFCGDAGEREIGGIRLNDLYSLKPTAAISPDLDLVAEALVAGSGALVSTQSSESLKITPQFKTIDTQLREGGSVLDQHYARTLEFPIDAFSLARVLGAQWSQLRDPWGTRYVAKFSIERDDNVIQLMSSGPDKKAGTGDDFVAGVLRRSYFAPLRIMIEQALKRQESYPANESELRALLRANGLLLDSLRDP